MRTIAALAMTLGCAATAAAQPSLAEQALQHLERPTAKEDTPPQPRTAPAPTELAVSSLEVLRGAAAPGRPNNAHPARVSSQGHGVGVFGPLLLIPVILVGVLGLLLTKRQTLNFGLRYARGLGIGAAFAAVWLVAASQMAGGGDVYKTLVLFIVAPGVLTWSLPLFISLKERLVEHQIFRRWFLFERGGSARWAGPRQYRAYSAPTFRRSPDPKEGYTSG